MKKGFGLCSVRCEINGFITTSLYPLMKLDLEDLLNYVITSVIEMKENYTLRRQVNIADNCRFVSF